jgi:hypothetical protein
MANTALDYYNAEINTRFTAEYVNAPATEYLAKALEAKQAFMREHLCSQTELWYAADDETGYAPAFGTDSPFVYAANPEAWEFIRGHADGRDKQVVYSHHVQVPVRPAEQHDTLCYFHATTFSWWHCWHVRGHAPAFNSKAGQSNARLHIAYEQTTYWWPDGPEQYSTCWWLVPYDK